MSAQPLAGHIGRAYPQSGDDSAAQTPWDLPPRIAAKIAVDAESGCWLWTGARMEEGYGRVKLDGKAAMAYRVTYEILHRGIPAGRHIDHLCRVPRCVNPRHLQPVTLAENARRQVDASRQEPIFRCGHPRTIENTRTRRGRPGVRWSICCRTCAAATTARKVERQRERRATTREQAAA